MITGKWEVGYSNVDNKWWLYRLLCTVNGTELQWYTEKQFQFRREAQRKADELNGNH